ncbi:hypothetical protein [uncultured Aquimarina sp.]|uniref:hypothetical protein n=1 Tax=uncultured Aquimarina sp. TaxID=575652 RepID=UPI002639074C|nr:hypothetical protein [uncultured Aquimarina sp.]
MRTLILITASLILGICTTIAQTTETSTSKSSSEFSITYDSDSPNKKFYRSFVTLDMDNDYRIKVRFMKYMKSDVKSYLIDQFGKENMIVKDNTYFWNKEIDEEEMYEVRLKGNKLRINLNKDLASDKLVKRFVEIGKELKSITSNSEKS